MDVTQPGTYHQVAPIHIIHQIIDECIEIFESIGFVTTEGPDVELDYYNFTALNFPIDHPAMEMHDTFYVSDHHLLRTHTSPVQVRVMEKTRPPIAIISPGACFRSDTPDATHSPYFHQIEGLCVDEGISLSDLKGVLTFFYQSLLSPDVNLRFRPSYFPFTEPSTEVDISCIFCKGKGCRICKSTGWIESCGAGMVDPGVFKFVDYDPEKFSGYAFGIGIERLAMLKYQIHDIRLFFENNLNFLNQF
jgi:phenylalanyl-tRNA synthetase alpha chain